MNDDLSVYFPTPIRHDDFSALSRPKTRVHAVAEVAKTSGGNGRPKLLVSPATLKLSVDKALGGYKFYAMETAL